ncbi:MAG: isoprenylcysteine carboxylmethyltransferase family protein [Flavobacteriales bacterium]|nr:isoprenylcysteine carboxylmethyltransferase family protein [Flavobacteriales bacterium]
MSEERNAGFGTLLVIGQFTAIAGLLLGGSWLLPWWAWVTFALGLLVFLLAATSLGVNNFTAMPVPREGNTLSKKGIYRFVRHPMYLSVLLCGAAVALGAPTIWRWMALGLALIVLLVKIGYEERRLTAKHPEYPELMRGVARLVPGVW